MSIFYNYWVGLDSSVCCSTLLFCGATSELGLRRSFGTTLITFSCASSRKEIRQDYLLDMVTVNLIINFEEIKFILTSYTRNYTASKNK